MRPPGHSRPTAIPRRRGFAARPTLTARTCAAVSRRCASTARWSACATADGSRITRASSTAAGRDVGWIRETLEGSVYLLISGLYDPRGPEAQWILDDYQDNRYMSPPYGYAIVDQESDWFSRGGLSIQPNLLAGLMPYLDRDEPEVYLWMFFNAWVACYREEINAMVEHPYPELGYSNTAHPKTSDEANAVMWLRYMFVYGNHDGLYLGRAIPRAWFAQSRPMGLENVVTRWGQGERHVHPRGHRTARSARRSI